MLLDESTYLQHYGILRRSGRYPWGSGDNVPERSKTFLDYVKQMLGMGLTEAEIAEGVGITTKELRELKTIARAEKKAADVAFARRLKDKGMSNMEIGRRMDIRESSVRSLLAPGADEKAKKLHSTADMLRRAVDEKQYVDVGDGVENHLQISKEFLSTAVTILKDEGYVVNPVDIEQAGTGLQTRFKVLSPPGTTQYDAWSNRDKIQLPAEFSNDRGETFSKFQPPMSIDSSRVAINYAETGGTEADGLMYIRPDVPDVSIGANSYAQVRVAVDGSHYIKGMAIYKDDLPDGVDILFNTNKSDTGNKLDALKPLQRRKDGSIDEEFPFGSVIKRQILKLDSDGNEVLTSTMNLVNEEGDWDKWSSNFSSQFLSKQEPRFATQQLDELYKQRKADMNEINALTNPIVRQKLLMEFADHADSTAVDLYAASLPRTSTHVLIPIPKSKIKDTEIYAPNFENGERVALVRHPHGGRFEIPELVVNNNNPAAKKLLGRAPDAVGINSKVAERLSGADFDGDSVLVIPNNRGQVQSAPALKRLVDFDPKATYKLPDDSPIPRMTKRQKQLEMGSISNLITDMTIMGAGQDEIARAVAHSMVVIDAEKHGLNYRQSAIDHGIPNLRQKYLGRADKGASTIVSRAGRDVYVPDRKLRSRKEGGPIDPDTGKLVYVPTGKTRVNAKGETVLKKTKVQELALTDDAFTLSSGHRVETIYATHSNRLKAMANEARKEAIGIKGIPYSPSAKKTYAQEVDSLEAKLNVARKNRPLERRAQVIAGAEYAARKRDNPDMTNEEKKKVKSQALINARAATGAGKQRIEPTAREWEAIQAGAITNSRLREILQNADMDKVKELAMPRTQNLMSSTQLQRAKSMANSGHTQAEIANALGVGLTTLKTALKEGG